MTRRAMVCLPWCVWTMACHAVRIQGAQLTRVSLESEARTLNIAVVGLWIPTCIYDGSLCDICIWNVCLFQTAPPHQREVQRNRAEGRKHLLFRFALHLAMSQHAKVLGMTSRNPVPGTSQEFTSVICWGCLGYELGLGWDSANKPQLNFICGLLWLLKAAYEIVLFQLVFGSRMKLMVCGF